MTMSESSLDCFMQLWERLNLKPITREQARARAQMIIDLYARLSRRFPAVQRPLEESK